MNFDDARPFIERNHRAVVNTIQPDGAVQSSVVVAGAYQESAAFVAIRGNEAKVRNLRRDPRCTILHAAENWRSYATVEGEATLRDLRNTDPETLRLLLRDVYRACGGGEHPNWAEYDEAMKRQDAVVVQVRPRRVYGLIR